MSHAVSRELLKDVESFCRANGVQPNQPAGEISTIKCGGLCRWFLEPAGFEAILRTTRFFTERGQPPIPIGNGSKVLVSDRGLPGLTLYLRSHYNQFRLDRDGIVAQSGIYLPKLSQLYLLQGWSGMEFGCAFPATLGGAIIMNAGAHGAEIGPLVDWVRILNEQGQVEEIPARLLTFRYRQSSLKGRRITILEARLRRLPQDPAKIREKMEANKEHRATTQPAGWAGSFGSIFKNPGNGLFAAKLLEEVQAKGTRVGGARVSPVHANFMENSGDATAEDVYELACLLRKRVLEKSSIHLEFEFIPLGEFGGG